MMNTERLIRLCVLVLLVACGSERAASDTDVGDGSVAVDTLGEAGSGGNVGGNAGGNEAGRGGAAATGGSNAGGNEAGRGGVAATGGSDANGGSIGTGGASGGSGPMGGSGGQTQPDPSVEVPVKTPMKAGEASVETKTVLGTPMLITEGVRAALIPSGGVFAVAAGQDVDNKEGFVAAKVALDGTVHWKKSYSFHEGGAGPVAATDSRYYLGGAKLWAFAPGDGAAEETDPNKFIRSFSVYNGQVVALVTEPTTPEAQRGSTFVLEGTTLTAGKIFELPHLEWLLPGPLTRSTKSDVEFSRPSSIVRLGDGTFGVQGGVRGHTYLVRLNQQREALKVWQSTEDDSRYLNDAGLGRRNSDFVYVTTVDPPGIQTPTTWRVARARPDLSGDAWSRNLEPLGGDGRAARGVVVLASGHILVYSVDGIYILAGESGEATKFVPNGVGVSSVLALPDGFLLVGTLNKKLHVAKYVL